MIEADAGSCPKCGTALVGPQNRPNWCPACEWNLGVVDARPDAKVSRRVRRVHRRAFRLDREMFERLQSHPPDRPTLTPAKAFLISLSVFLYLVDIALVVGGIWLIVAGFFVLKIVGVFFVLLGLELRPRISKPTDDPIGGVDRSKMPELFALVDDVSAAAGGPTIDTIILTPEFNASCGREGWRRRPVLRIGLPLWAALDAQSRLAMLAHEVGHLVNGDPERALLIQPALTTFGRVAAVATPARIRSADQFVSLAGLVSAVIAQLVFRPLSWLAIQIQVRLYALAARDHQLAEYYADALSMRLAGSDAAQELHRTLLFGHRVFAAVHRCALDSANPVEWRSAVVVALNEAADDEAIREQHSLRIEASLFASHPPSGYRLRLVRSWPRAEPKLTLSEQRSAAIDQAMSAQWTRTKKALNNTQVG